MTCYHPVIRSPRAFYPTVFFLTASISDTCCPGAAGSHFVSSKPPGTYFRGTDTDIISQPDLNAAESWPCIMAMWPGNNYFLLDTLVTLFYMLLGLSGLTLITIYFIPSLAVDPNSSVPVLPTPDNPNPVQPRGDAGTSYSTSFIIESNQPHSKLIALFIVGMVTGIQSLCALPHYLTHPELIWLGIVSSTALAGVVVYDISLFPIAHGVCLVLFVVALGIYAHIYCFSLLGGYSMADAQERLQPCVLAFDMFTLLFLSLFVANWMVTNDSGSGIASYRRGSLETYQTAAELLWEMAILAFLACITSLLSRWRMFNQPNNV